MPRSICFVAAAAAVLAFSSPSLAQPTPSKTTDSILVVPFGVSGPGDVKLAASLTAASAEALAEKGTVSLAKAPLVDILTLIECPSGELSCIGALAEALGVHLALTGQILSDDNGTVARISLVRRDRTVDRFVHVLGTEVHRAESRRFQAALRARLGLTGSGAKPAAGAALVNSDSAAGAAKTPLPQQQAEMIPTPAQKRSPEYDHRRAGLGNVRPISWTTAAIGVVALGLGGVSYLQARSTEDEVLRAPSQTREDLEALEKLEERGDRQLTTATFFLTVGAIGTAAGAALILWDASQPAATTSLGVGPVDDNGGISVTMRGSF